MVNTTGFIYDENVEKILSYPIEEISIEDTAGRENEIKNERLIYDFVNEHNASLSNVTSFFKDTLNKDKVTIKDDAVIYINNTVKLPKTVRTALVSKFTNKVEKADYVVDDRQGDNLQSDMLSVRIEREKGQGKEQIKEIAKYEIHLQLEDITDNKEMLEFVEFVFVIQSDFKELTQRLNSSVHFDKTFTKYLDFPINNEKEVPKFDISSFNRAFIALPNKFTYKDIFFNEYTLYHHKDFVWIVSEKRIYAYKIPHLNDLKLKLSLNELLEEFKMFKGLSVSTELFFNVIDLLCLSRLYYYSTFNYLNFIYSQNCDIKYIQLCSIDIKTNRVSFNKGMLDYLLVSKLDKNKIVSFEDYFRYYNNKLFSPNNNSLIKSFKKSYQPNDKDYLKLFVNNLIFQRIDFRTFLLYAYYSDIRNGESIRRVLDTVDIKYLIRVFELKFYVSLESYFRGYKIPNKFKEQDNDTKLLFSNLTDVEMGTLKLSYLLYWNYNSIEVSGIDEEYLLYFLILLQEVKEKKRNIIERYTNFSSTFNFYQFKLLLSEQDNETYYSIIDSELKLKRNEFKTEIKEFYDLFLTDVSKGR